MSEGEAQTTGLWEEYERTHSIDYVDLGYARLLFQAGYRAAKTRPAWTREKSTVPGFYVYWHPEKGPPLIDHVAATDVGHMTDYGGWWLPLTPPAAPEGHGDPNFEREYLEGMREELAARQRVIERLEGERDRLRAALETVRSIHQSDGRCCQVCGAGGGRYPCDTMVEVGAALASPAAGAEG